MNKKKIDSESFETHAELFFNSFFKGEGVLLFKFKLSVDERLMPMFMEGTCDVMYYDLWTGLRLRLGYKVELCKCFHNL